MTRSGWLCVSVAFAIGAACAAGDDGRRPGPLELVLGERLAKLERGVAAYQPKYAGAPAHPSVEELRRKGVVVDEVPVNPLNGSAEIQGATWNESDPPVTGTAGWNYDDQAGRVWSDCRLRAGAVPVDQSLALKGYLSRGVPDPAGTWNGSAALQASQALEKLGPTRLPRLHSERSAALFDRLVSPDNLAACGDRRRLLSDRLTEAAQHVVATGNLLELYALAFETANVGDFEAIAIQAHALRAAAMVAKLGDEVLADQSGSDGELKRRRDTVAQIHSALGALVARNIEMLSLLGSAPPELRQWLVESMDETVPVIVAHLPPAVAEELTMEILSLDVDDLRPALTDLAAAVDKARSARADAVANVVDE